ncbi:hypothetical protein ME121_6182 [Methylobacterium sp. ME121]|nr:hypothetical protein ME121_6182 [Methylobacterium sp. ME121]
MVTRPQAGNSAQTLASIESLCDAADVAAAQIADLEGRVASAQGAVTAEVIARQQAVSGEAQARDAAVTAEAQARQQAVSSEANTRAVAIASATKDLGQRISELRDSLSDALRAETQARTTADAAEQMGRVEAIAAQAKALADAVAEIEAQIAVKADSTALTQQIADAVAAIRVVTDGISATITTQRLDFTAYPGRPGDAPTRYTFVTAAAALAGPRAALPLIPPAMLAGTESGAVVRVDGAGIVAGRAACPLEPGRLYRSRYVIQRRANPADPSGDAVLCGLVYLDQSLRVLGAVVPVRTYSSLVTANGRQECEALIARSTGLGAAFRAPASARFMVPVVALFGPDALTDVEVLSIEDVTGAFVLAPPPDGLEARIMDAIGALVGRVQVLESEAGTPSKLTFGSKGDAAYAAIPAGVQVVELLGRKFAGDGGGGRYVRTSAQLAADADSFVCHGAVFVREVVASDVVAGMLESGYEAWVASLPTEPPPGSGKRWNNNGIPEVTP